MTKMLGGTAPWTKEKMEKYQWLDEFLLGQQGTKKEFQPAWQAYKYVLKDKMYAYIGINDKNGRPIITLKLDPDHSDMLRSEYQDIVPGYYMNKEHWSTAYLDGEVPREVLQDMVYFAHKVVLSSLSKKAQKELCGE